LIYGSIYFQKKLNSVWDLILQSAQFNFKATRNFIDCQFVFCDPAYA